MLNPKTAHTYKTLTVKIATLFICALAGWWLYSFFGHPLVRAVVQAKSTGHLFTQPLAFYLNQADILFYNIWPVLCVGFSMLIITQWFFFQKNAHQSKSDYSFPHIKIIFLLSLGIRFLVLPFLVSLTFMGDEYYYWNTAKSLLGGDFTPLTLRPPLWTFVLFLLTQISNDYFFARTVTSLIGACCPVLLYLVGTKAFNKRTGFVAALIYAVYPNHIGYSHYLWSEILFGFLCLLAVYFFLLYIEDKQQKKFLILSFFTSGMALLSKEFAVILFAGLIVTLFFVRPEKIIKKLMFGLFLFLLPGLLYSFTLSHVTNTTVIVSNAPISNFRIALGLSQDFNYTTDSNEKRTETRNELADSLKSISIRSAVKKMQQQFYNLWTPNSFPIYRLVGKQTDGYYPQGIRGRWAIPIAGFYLFIVFTGLVGLFWAEETTAFRVFSITSLVCLSLTSVLAFLCSRFRFPFMYIFIIYSAYLLVNVKTILKNIRHSKNLKKVTAMTILLILLVHIAWTKVHTIGRWG